MTKIAFTGALMFTLEFSLCLNPMKRVLCESESERESEVTMAFMTFLEHFKCLSITFKTFLQSFCHRDRFNKIKLRKPLEKEATNLFINNEILLLKYISVVSK